MRRHYVEFLRTLCVATGLLAHGCNPEVFQPKRIMVETTSLRFYVEAKKN